MEIREFKFDINKRKHVMQVRSEAHARSGSHFSHKLASQRADVYVKLELMKLRMTVGL